jgi:hypothetical protein
MTLFPSPHLAARHRRSGPSDNMRGTSGGSAGSICGTSRHEQQRRRLRAPVGWGGRQLLGSPAGIPRCDRAGWAEPHFLVHQGFLPPNVVMLYAPRDEEEARVLLALVRSSYEHAMTNTSSSPSPSATSIRSAS